MDNEAFILWSPDLAISPQQFDWEGDAQQLAERIARANRGARIYIAKVTASVLEPLPELQWSDGRAAGGVMGGLGPDPRRIGQDVCGNTADALAPKQPQY